MATCKHCGKEISTIVTSFFDHEGGDYERELPFCVQENNAITVSTDKSWTGYELSEEEQMDTIRCPYCGKFPFEPEVQVEEVVEIVMFRRTKMSDFNTIIESITIDNDGLIKVVVLNYVSDTGWRCGYVGVPEGHPLYGKKYEEIENDFEVNGGLTFSDYNDRCDKEAGVNNKYWYLGFDCAHVGDVLDRETKNKYNISRDSEFGYKFQRVWDKESVIREVNNLANQIKEIYNYGNADD